MLTQLRLENFRKFTRKQLQFGAGINVVRGLNEAGKSTLLSSIFTGLYADATSRGQKQLTDIRSWRADAPLPQINLDFLTDNANLKLTRDFATRAQVLQDLSSGTTWRTAPEIATVLTQKLRLPGEKEMLATMFVRQSELSRVIVSSDLREALQNLSALTPEGESLSKRLQVLQDELQQLRLGLARPAKTPGPLKSTLEQLERSRVQVAQLQSQQVQQQQTLSAGVGSEEKLAELVNDLAAIELKLQNQQKLEAGLTKLKSVQQTLAELGRLAQETQSASLGLKQVEAALQSIPRLPAARTEELSSQLISLRQEQKTLATELEEAEDKLRELRKQHTSSEYLQREENKQKRSYISNLGFLGIGIGLVVTILGQLLQLGLVIGSGVGIVLFGAVVVLVTSLRNKSSQSNPQAQVAQLKPELTVLHAQMESMQEKLQRAKTEEAELLREAQASDYNEFFTRKARWATLITEKERNEASVQALLGERSLAQLQSEISQLQLEEKRLQEQELTVEVRAAQMNPSEYLKLRREQERLQQERRNLERDLTVSKTRTSDAGDLGGNLLQTQEQLSVLESQYSQLQQREQILELTLRLLEQALRNASQRSSSTIGGTVRALIGKLTAGNYDDLRFSEDFAVEVHHVAENKWLAPETVLSSGTIDQVYFLARLALSKSLLGGPLPYLFLDDPFVTFDGQRLDAVREILSELAKTDGTQIFIFTHSEIYRDWGNYQEL